MSPYTPTTWVEDVTKLGPTNMNKIEQGLVDVHAFVGAKVRQENAQSISTAVNTLLVFDTEELDTHGFWTPGAPDRMTIPAGMAGVYLCIGQLEWAQTSVAGTRRICLVNASGGTVYAEAYQPASPSVRTAQTVSVIMPLPAGGTFALIGYQDSGVSIATVPTSSVDPSLMIARLGT